MNKAKILRASKALWRLEEAQDKFNEAVNELSNEELKTWAKQNDLRLEVSKTKERIKNILEKPQMVVPDETKGEKHE